MFGLIPEFIGRLPVISTLDELDEDGLVAILRTPKNSLLKQYQKIFELEGVDIEFTEAAARAIAAKAIKRKSGARGLRSVLEHALLDLMYRAPEIEGLTKIIVDEKTVTEGKDATMILSDSVNKKQA